MIAFDRLESLKQGLYEEYKKNYIGLEDERGDKWNRCWAFISMMYPDYAFRSAGGYWYRKVTGLPDPDNSWAKKGKFFWDRMCITVEMYANGALTSSIEGE